jgi:hypothetical protein
MQKKGPFVLSHISSIAADEVLPLMRAAGNRQRKCSPDD